MGSIESKSYIHFLNLIKHIMGILGIHIKDMPRTSHDKRVLKETEDIVLESNTIITELD